VAKSIIDVEVNGIKLREIEKDLKKELDAMFEHKIDQAQVPI